MDFKEQVKKSFASCKEDIKNLQENNSNVNQRLESLERENSQLRTELHEMKSILQEIKSGLTQSKQQAQETMISQETVSPEPQSSPIENGNPIATMSPETHSSNPQKEDPYEALLAFKARANKKEALKQKMVSMITENGINLSELKFMIVNHFKYCSKATFYNYLKELELERFVRIERHHSKNIIYIEGIRNQQI